MTIGGALKGVLVPGSMLAIVASILLPLPPAALDFLVVVNLLLGFALLLSTLYISDPLKLSALPTLLLFATLYRLALTISTTRAILGAGDAGHVIQAFGEVVIQGNLVVGLVVFLIITVVQFIVIAKGAERVAEVAARFTLDALPGKQMSIDADVRAGLLDFEAARNKRQELQIESRFYGALDGAMKFIKGDSIAGLVSVAVNLLGGIIIGAGIQGMDLRIAASHYSILTIGDGLAAQIPALLNALAAGMVVTRVARGDGRSIATELPAQLGQLRVVKVLAALMAIILGCLPGMPLLPFVVVSAILLVMALVHREENVAIIDPRSRFEPRNPRLISIELNDKMIAALKGKAELLQSALTKLRQQIYNNHGLVLPEVELVQGESSYGVRILIHGVEAARAADAAEPGAAIERLITLLESVIIVRLPEFVDDSMTRRILDILDREAPELVAAVVPKLLSVTQVTVLLRELAREGVSFRTFDVIAQTLAECGGKIGGERPLLEDTRVALRRIICGRFCQEDSTLSGYTTSAAIDLAFLRAEKEGRPLDPRIIDVLVDFFRRHETAGQVLLVSKGARAMLRDCLELRGVKIPVLAFEEIPAEVSFRALANVGSEMSKEVHDEILAPLAA